jgi:hypothetical protein
MTEPVDPKDASLVKDLEKAIRNVLKDQSLEPADRIKAIQAGTHLLAVKHKIRPSDDGEGFFGGSK